MLAKEKIFPALLVAQLMSSVLCGCRTAERTMLAVSRLKSPVTISTPAVNKAFTTDELVSAEIDPWTLKPASTHRINAKLGENPSNFGNGSPRFDAYADLRDRETIVIACLSGGGARAARMAAYTLASLEKRYNETFPTQSSASPFANQIHAWSSISGGSVYSSFIAAQLTGSKCFTNNTFDMLSRETRALRGTQFLGGMASFFYLWPGNLGYGPLMQFGTDWDTLDLFAHNLAMFHRGTPPLLPFSRMSTLGDLPKTPRFFFNATCRETARPFIFTQSVLHRNLGGDPLSGLDADPIIRWIEGGKTTNRFEPFRYASTLEDLGSPPNRFPLAYAAMASAAFPGVFDPLWLNCYRLSPTNSSCFPMDPKKLWWLRETVSLVDGGLYDNSGLITALELFEYLRADPAHRPKRLVLLAIDADNCIQGYTGANPSSGVPWQYDLPIRGAIAAVTTIRKLHDSQQCMVTAAIHRHIQSLVDEGALEYCAVSLKNALTATNNLEQTFVKRIKKHAIKQTWSQIQALGVFGLVEDIPTDFVLSNEEDENLEKTVKLLLDQKTNDKTLADRIIKAISDANLLH